MATRTKEMKGKSERGRKIVRDGNCCEIQK